MKIHLYRQTPFGLERINDKLLTLEEADALRRLDPLLLSKVSDEIIACNRKIGLAIFLLLVSIVFVAVKY